MKTKTLLSVIVLVITIFAKSLVVPNRGMIKYDSAKGAVENVTTAMYTNITLYSAGYVYTTPPNINLIECQERVSTAYFFKGLLNIHDTS